jgi:hypothetical protein
LDNVHVRASVLFQEVREGAVLLNLDTEQYVGLDEVGRAMWHALLGCASLEEAVHQMTDQYDGDAAAIRKDFSAFIKRLLDLGLVHVTDG